MCGAVKYLLEWFEDTSAMTPDELSKYLEK
jgi:hypothetical protein